MHFSIASIITVLALSTGSVYAADNACLTGNLAKFNALTTYLTAQSFCSKYYPGVGPTTTVTIGLQTPARDLLRARGTVAPRSPATTTAAAANKYADLYSSIYSNRQLASTYCHCAEPTRTVTKDCSPYTETVPITSTKTVNKRGTFAMTTSVTYETYICDPVGCPPSG